MIVPGLMWMFTWKGGWNNSFHSGYEQAFEYSSRYIFGMLVFVAVMFYLPMAQARQAVTGIWRSFFDFRSVRQVIRRRWLGCLILAGLYAIISVPVTVLTFLPYFIGKDNEAFLDLTALELLPILHRYMFLACLIVFPAFVFLRLVAARLYASAVREALQDGQLEPLGFENVGVEKLHIDVPDPRPERSAPTRFILWTGSLSGRITAGLLAVVVWLGFAFQIIVGQFVKYEENSRVGSTSPSSRCHGSIWFRITSGKRRKKSARRNDRRIEIRISALRIWSSGCRMDALLVV